MESEQICKASMVVTKLGETDHLFMGNAAIWENIKIIWCSERIRIALAFIRCKWLRQLCTECSRKS